MTCWVCSSESKKILVWAHAIQEIFQLLTGIYLRKQHIHNCRCRYNRLLKRSDNRCFLIATAVLLDICSSTLLGIKFRILPAYFLKVLTPGWSFLKSPLPADTYYTRQRFHHRRSALNATVILFPGKPAYQCYCIGWIAEGFIAIKRYIGNDLLAWWRYNKCSVWSVCWRTLLLSLPIPLHCDLLQTDGIGFNFPVDSPAERCYSSAIVAATWKNTYWNIGDHAVLAGRNDNFSCDLLFLLYPVWACCKNHKHPSICV